MRHSLSFILVSALFVFSLTAVAGDCNKTVMGGGCTGQVEGVSPHMQSQSPLNTVTKIKGKENAATPATKPAKDVKVSNANGQKPQI